MLNVVRFLEKMGSEAQWNDLPMEKMELALAKTDIEGPLRAAILNKDGALLQELLQQKPFVCMIEPGEEEEEDESEPEPGERDALSLQSFASLS